MSTGSGTLTDNETCTTYYNLSLGEDPFYFHTTSTIKRVHRDAIRFGKTSDISVLYRNDTTRSEKNEYLVGVTTTSIVIFAVITAWFVLILVCMCLGPDRVGFFSGRQRKAESGSKVSDENIEKKSSNGQENFDEENDADLASNGQVAVVVATDNAEDAIIDAVPDEQELDSVKNKEDDNGIDGPAPDGQQTGDFSNEGNGFEAANPTSDGQKNGDVGIVIESTVDKENENDENIANKETIQEEMIKKSFRNSLAVCEIQHDELTKLYRTRLVRSRIVVLLCSVGVVICVILFITFGVQNLVQSSSNVISGVQEGQELTKEAVMLVDNFLMRQKMALEVLTPFITEINGICPNVTKAICSNITDSKSCNFTDIPLSDEFETAYSFLIDNAQNAALAKADSLRDDLTELNDELGKVADQISSFNWAFAVATVFAVMLLIANLVISHGIIVAWRRETAPPKYECCSKIMRLARHWLMVPFFVFLVVMSWIFSMVFIIGSIATADLCYGSPDDTVLAVLKKDVLPLDSVIRDLFIFYVEGCPDYGVPDDLSNKVNSILNYADEVSNVAFGLQDEAFVERFVETCGNDTSVLYAASLAVKGTICNVGVTLAEIVLFFSCPNWSAYFLHLPQFLDSQFACVYLNIYFSYST
jgi:uncharacterized membrane protein YqhA